MSDEIGSFQEIPCKFISLMFVTNFPVLDFFIHNYSQMDFMGGSLICLCYRTLALITPNAFNLGECVFLNVRFLRCCLFFLFSSKLSCGKMDIYEEFTDKLGKRKQCRL